MHILLLPDIASISISTGTALQESSITYVHTYLGLPAEFSHLVSDRPALIIVHGSAMLVQCARKSVRQTVFCRCWGGLRLIAPAGVPAMLSRIPVALRTGLGTSCDRERCYLEHSKVSEVSSGRGVLH